MLGLLSIKTRLYSQNMLLSVSISLYHHTHTRTHRHTQYSLIQPHTLLVKQSLCIKYTEPHENSQLRAGNQNSELWGESLESFLLFSIICLMLRWQVENMRKEVLGKDMHKQISVCVQSMILKYCLWSRYVVAII